MIWDGQLGPSVAILIIFKQLNCSALDEQPFYCEGMLNAQNDQGEQIPQNNSLYLKDLLSTISKRFSLFFHLFLMSLCLPNPPTVDESTKKSLKYSLEKLGAPSSNLAIVYLLKQITIKQRNM